MKKTIILTLAVFILTLCALRSAPCAVLALKATWAANTEPDMKEYRLYRTDGTRTLLGTIPHPTVLYNFSVIVPDQSTGTLNFVLTAVDTNLNESLDSAPVAYPFNTDTVPPASPKGLTVQK